MWRFEQDPTAPARLAGDSGMAVIGRDGAVVEEGGNVWPLLTGDGFHPDVLVG